MIFVPAHQTMIWYLDPNEHFEGVLTRMKGVYGTHYLWRLWHVEGPGITFGWRIYPSNTKPVVMETTVLERYMGGKGNPTFPAKGQTVHPVLLFGEDAVRFHGMWLERETTDSNLTRELLSRLGGEQPL
jgi:hypothetical protein